LTDPEVDEAKFEQADEDSCSTCYYYLALDQGPAFCWHAKIQILVGHDWWCHYWEMPED
jgi:hypothetical protein